MGESLGYHLYHFKGKLPKPIEQQFRFSQDILFLKKPLKESIQTANITVNVNLQPPEKIDISTLSNDIILRKFFAGSALEQIYFAVPVEYPLMQKDENTSDFYLRVADESKKKLMSIFGVNFKDECFTIVSSIIVFVKNEKVFSDNKSYFDSISQFISHSYKIKSDFYINVNNYQIVTDFEGLGMIFSSSSVDWDRVSRVIFLLMLAKAYMATLEEISLGVVKPLVASQDYFKEAELIDQALDTYNRFLIRYYYHNPMVVDVNKTFYVYEMIKEVLKLREQYNESKEQIRILTELSRTKRRQITEMRAGIDKNEQSSLKHTITQMALQIKKISWVAFGILFIQFVLILILLSNG